MSGPQLLATRLEGPGAAATAATFAASWSLGSRRQHGSGGLALARSPWI